MTSLVFPSNPVNGQLYPEQGIPGVNQYSWGAAIGVWVLVRTFPVTPFVSVFPDNPVNGQRYPNVGNPDESQYEWESSSSTWVITTNASPPVICDQPPFYCSVDVDPYCVTNFAYTWYNCFSLTSFPLLNVSQGTDFTSTWRDCTNLTSFPPGMFDSCLGTGFTNAWHGCALDQTSVDNILASLDTAGQSNGFVTLSGGTSAGPSVAGLAAKASLEGKGWTVLVNASSPYSYCTPAYPGLPVTFPPYGCDPNVNTTGVTDFTDAWSNCSSLTDFPCIDSSSVTNFSYSWKYCYGLTSFPTINTSAGINFTYTWSYTGLTTFPLLNTSNGTIFYGAWNNCPNLSDFPFLDVSAGENFTYAWYECSGLTSFPALNVGQGTSFEAAWYNCSGLTLFPAIDVSSGVNFDSAWQGCTSLTSFPLLNVSQGIDFTRAWVGCTSLTSFPAGMFDSCLATSFYYAWQFCALDQTSVDNILVSLDTAGQMFGTVSLGGGTSSPPGIAGTAALLSLQAKGWTVIIN